MIYLKVLKNLTKSLNTSVDVWEVWNKLVNILSVQTQNNDLFSDEINKPKKWIYQFKFLEANCAKLIVLFAQRKK